MFAADKSALYAKGIQPGESAVMRALVLVGSSTFQPAAKCWDDFFPCSNEGNPDRMYL